MPTASRPGTAARARSTCLEHEHTARHFKDHSSRRDCGCGYNSSSMHFPPVADHQTIGPCGSEPDLLSWRQGRPLPKPSVISIYALGIHTAVLTFHIENNKE